jgi:Na+/proline symporter
MILLVLVFAGIGMLCAGLAVPLIKGWVKPNHWYGFRIRLTLEDPRLWYPANRYAGWLLLVYGLVIVVASFGCYVFLGGVADEAALETYGLIFSALLVVGIVVVLILCLRYAQRLAREHKAESDIGQV